MAYGVAANRLELLQIADAVARDKSIDKKVVLGAMEEAMQRAAKARYGSENEIRVEIDHNGAEFRALHDAVDDLTDAVLELLVLAFALGIAHLLHDHLLGGLRCDAREIDWRKRLGDDVADLRGRIARARVVEADFDLVVVD